MSRGRCLWTAVRGGEAPARAGTCCLPLLLLLVLPAVSASGQAVQPVHEPVLSNLPVTDDIEVHPLGTLIASFPLAQEVRTRPPGGPWSTLTTGFVQGMVLDNPPTALWVTEFDNGIVRRVDLGTGLTTRSFTVPGHPVEVIHDNNGGLLVGSLATPNHAMGTGTIYRVTLTNGGPIPPPQPMVSGIPGAMDLVYDDQGRLLMTTLISTELHLVQPGPGTFTPLGGLMLQPSDMVAGQPGRIFVSTLILGEIVEVNLTTTPPSTTRLAGLMGGAIGAGCEDLAYDSTGHLLVSMNYGEIRRLAAAKEVQVNGIPIGGLPVQVSIDSAAHAGWGYQIVVSQGLGPGIPVPGSTQVFPLALDQTLLDTLLGVGPHTGLSGTLDPQGRAGGWFFSAPLPPGVQQDHYFGAVMIEPATGALYLHDFVQQPFYGL